MQNAVANVRAITKYVFTEKEQVFFFFFFFLIYFVEFVTLSKIALNFEFLVWISKYVPGAFIFLVFVEEAYWYTKEGIKLNFVEKVSLSCYDYRQMGFSGRTNDGNGSFTFWPYHRLWNMIHIWIIKTIEW